MENNEKLICKADIKCKVSKVFLLIIGLLYLSWFIPVERSSGWGTCNLYGYYSEWNEYSIITVVLIILLAFILLNILLIIVNSKRCDLSLYDNKLKGNIKKIISSASLDLPINKIDNIMIKDGFIDKLFGGRTIEIRSASSVMKFHYIQNAQEFADLSLSHIEQYKKNASAEKAPVIAANSNNTSIAAQIKELKELLDSEIISQEEFDAKKQELLSKM